MDCRVSGLACFLKKIATYDFRGKALGFTLAVTKGGDPGEESVLVEAFQAGRQPLVHSNCFNVFFSPKPRFWVRMGVKAETPELIDPTCLREPLSKIIEEYLMFIFSSIVEGLRRYSLLPKQLAEIRGDRI
jgi:hypothetical protein